MRELFIDFKKACDLVRWEVLYNNLTESGISLETRKDNKNVSV